MSFFVIFFQKVFRKPKFNFVSKIEFHNPVVGGCQSTLKSQGLRILPHNVTAQVFVVFQISYLKFLTPCSWGLS